jgi:2-polyprenyl-6-methoxyphenol hydroxylase-like FAD-dependent oxidoreductase
MSTTTAVTLGERAIVLGAGIAGTLVARALAEHFTRVTVIERDGDDARDAEGFRKGVPQGRMLHGVLRGGLDSMNALFPELEQELYTQGAVRSKPLRDALFVDALGLWPRHDAGVEVPLLSRPLLEGCLHAALARVANVELLAQRTVQGLVGDGARIRGVVVRDEQGETSELHADLIVDATGRAAHTGAWLTALGLAPPEETRVEVDFAYACCFIRPRKKPPALGVMVIEPPPSGRHVCLIQAQEGDRMIAAIGSRGRGTPLPNEYEGMLAVAEQLPHPAAFEALRDADPLTPVARFGFPASVHRHYERLARVPDGFLCIGDAICSFNPVWGQGMSVAALEVAALQRLLAARAAEGASLAGLPGAFYREAARVIAVAWQFSVMPDFAYDSTRGERPAGLSAGRGFMRALGRLAQREPEVRALIDTVLHFVAPPEALRAPDLIARVLPLMEAP